MTNREQDTIQGLAQAKGETTSDLIRKALDEYVAKAGFSLSDETKDAVAVRAAAQINTEIDRSMWEVPGQVAKELGDLRDTLAVLTKRLEISESEVGIIVSPD